MAFTPYPKPEKKQKAKAKKIKPRSSKRAQEERSYSVLRKLFLENHKRCERCGSPATDVHHKAGRIGKMLLFIKYWMAICRPCHDHITKYSKEAIEQGWSLPRNSQT